VFYSIIVTFSLETAPIDGEVYVFGELSNWQLNNKLFYDSVFNGYRGNFVIKQGWYNYLYFTKSDTLKLDYFEGSHFETENQYEIFVYYRSVNLRSDLLVGYFSFNVNSMNK